MTGIPCSECGTDVLNGKQTTGYAEVSSFEFGGEVATKELPARECPECGTTNVI